MELNVSGLPYGDSWANLQVDAAQGLELGTSSTAPPIIIAPSQQSQDIRAISFPREGINDLLHVRKDLHFPVTMDKSKFTEIMHPKSEEDLEKYMPWMCLVHDIFQPRPKIVEDTHEELKQINLSSEKDFDPIREQRYWQNQIFLRWAVEEGLSNGYNERDLKSWLEDLHKIACSGLDGDNHYYVCDPRNGKFSSVSEGIMTRYQNKSPEEIEACLEKFKQFLDLSISSKNKQDWLADLAEKYVDVTICPPFNRVNNSTVMNILNLMLKKHGMNEISHGNLDQSVFFGRLNDEKLKKAIGEFPSIFLRAILQTNPKLETELSPLLNTPARYAENDERYLKKLSELHSSGVLNSETYHLMKYLSRADLTKKCQIFQKTIEFKDLLGKGVEKGVFTDELLTNCLKDVSKAFDNLNLSKDSFKREKCLVLESLGLKSRYPNFDTRVSSLEELSSNRDRELAVRNIMNGELVNLHTEGLNFIKQ